MAIKTDAMIAHGGAEGYTLYIYYNPENDAFDVKAVFNDGTVKYIEGVLDDGTNIDLLVSRNIVNFETDAPTIGLYAFRGCSILETLIINEATAIGGYAMGNCAALKYVYISGKCTNINVAAFNNVTQSDLIIDCGFSADSTAASNAPWGATNATINYDVAAPNPPALSSIDLEPNQDLINIIEPIEDIQPVEPEPSEKER